MRRFSLLDAMILVAAIALGAYGYRVNYAKMNAFTSQDNWIPLIGTTLASLTGALVILRMIPPRPQELQAGTIAAFVLLAQILGQYIETFILHITDFSTFPANAIDWYGVTHSGSWCIFIVWGVLALIKSFKTERTWIDRSLRGMAVIWILAGMLSMLQIIINSMPHRLSSLFHQSGLLS